MPALREQPSVWVILRLCVILGSLWPSPLLSQTGKVVRHHKHPVADPSSPPELTQAEAASEKKDYATAETLLNTAVHPDPKHSAAWSDLVCLYNALAKRKH